MCAPPFSGPESAAEGQRAKQHDNMKAFGKLKPLLITAAISIAAVYIWNSFLAPRIAGGKFIA